MLSSLSNGLRLIGRHKKAVVCLYLANLLVASSLIFSFMEIFDRSLGQGLYREELVQTMNYDWYRLFQENVGGVGSTFGPSVMGSGPFLRNLEMLLDGRLDRIPGTILLLAVLYLLFNSFFIAALVGSFVLYPLGTSWREFFRTGGIFFGRFLRLSFLALLTFTLLYAVVTKPLEYLVGYMATIVTTDIAAFYCSLVRYLIVLSLFMFVNMVLDYTKVRTVLENRTSILLAFISSWSFCVGYLGTTLRLYSLLVLIHVGWVLIYAGLGSSLIQVQNAWGIFGFFIWQQVFMAGRLVVKMLFTGSQMNLYTDLRPSLEPIVETRQAMNPQTMVTVVGP